MTLVHTIVPLTFAWCDVPLSVSVEGGDPGVRVREPVPGVLCGVDGGWVLLDTGYNDALITDAALRRRFHPAEHGIVPHLPANEQDCLHAAFVAAGVDPADVVAVAVSHLHNDHAGGLRHFAGRTPVYCQRRELSYGMDRQPAAERNGIYRVDFDDPAIDWRLADGTVEIVPGITAVPTYGHTPGHQSFAVTLDGAAAERYGIPGFVFAFDAADLQHNIDDEVAVGGRVGCGPEVSVEAIRGLKSMAREQGFRLVPGHDPHVWPALTSELAQRRAPG